MSGRTAATDTYRKQSFLKSKSLFVVSVLKTAGLTTLVLPAFPGQVLKWTGDAGSKPERSCLR